MSKKDQAKDYILQQIEKGEKHYAAKTAETFQIARSTVYNYISELVRDQIITKNDDGQYRLLNTVRTFFYSDRIPDEDSIFVKDILPLIKDLPANVVEAWRYAFTEMMNNAIEHSESKDIFVHFMRNQIITRISILDAGVGIFKKIQEYMKCSKCEELTLVECMSLLFAGKFTTAREYHSGEGIFFTSHLMDRFFIFSDDLCFSRNNFADDYSNMELPEKGTSVYMELSNKSQKTVTEIFNRYTNPEEGFTHTCVPIAHMFTGGSPVSRSEARRLGAMLIRFKEATLDFTGVTSIGQAFTHELFVVWQRKNPDIVLNRIGMGKDVENMIKRVLVDANKDA